MNELLLEHGLPMTILDPEGEAGRSRREQRICSWWANRHTQIVNMARADGSSCVGLSVGGFQPDVSGLSVTAW